MKSSIKKPNFRVKHPYGYLIKSMLVGFVLVFTSILSFGTGLIDLNPKSKASAADDTISEAFSSAYSNSVDFSGGDGTSGNPYIISSVEDWAHFDWHVDNYNGGYGYYYKLGQDIDFSGYRYDTFIGAYSITAPNNSKATSITTSSTGKSFAGVFWGDGFRLMNITPASEGAWEGGVFKTICGVSALTTTINPSTTPVGVYDLVVINFNSSGLGQDSGSGILADHIRYARIANVYVFTDRGYTLGVSAGANFGGVIGKMEGSQLWACQAEGYTIYGCESSGGIVSIAGADYGNNYISNCRNKNKVVAGWGECTNDFGWSAGGILGSGTFKSGGETVIQNCVNLGEVTTGAYGSSTVNGSQYYTNTLNTIHGIAGGANIAGANSSQNSYLNIYRCYNDAPVRVSTYVNGSKTTVQANYAIAHTMYGSSSHKNYFNNTYNTSGTASSSTYVQGVSAFYDWDTDEYLGDINNSTYGYAEGRTIVCPNMINMKGGYPSVNASTSSSSAINRWTSSTEPSNLQFTTIGKIIKVQNKIDGASITGQPFGTPRYTDDTSYYYLYDSFADSSPAGECFLIICYDVPYGTSIRVTDVSFTSHGDFTRETIVTSSEDWGGAVYYVRGDVILDHEITFEIVETLDGGGTLDEPYLLSTLEDLLAMGDLDAENKYFALVNDITINENYEASKSLFSEDGDLEGTLLGRGHTITLDFGNDYSQTRFFHNVYGGIYDLNIYIKNPIDNILDDPYQVACCLPAIGGYICEFNYGTIDSVRVFMNDATYSLDGFSGTNGIVCSLIASYNMISGVISNCLVTGLSEGDRPNVTITADSSGYYGINFGAITAISEGSVIGCVVDADITIGSTIATSMKSGNGSSLYAGGVVGYLNEEAEDYDNPTEVSNCYYQGHFYDPSNAKQGSNTFTAGIVGTSYYLKDAYGPANVHHNISVNLGAINGGSTGGWKHPVVAQDEGYPMSNWYIDANAYDIGYKIQGLQGALNNGEFGSIEDWDSRYWMPTPKSGLGNFIPNFEMWAPRNFKAIPSALSGRAVTNWTADSVHFTVGAYDEDIAFSGTTAKIKSAGGLSLLAFVMEMGIEDVRKVVLDADIDLSKLYWSPIVFRGINEFDGQGHTIYGLDSMGSYYTDSYDSLAQGKNLLGGLFATYNATPYNVHDIVFENCILHDAFGRSDAGFVSDTSNGHLVSNITFKSCTIYQDYMIRSGDYRGSGEDGNTYAVSSYGFVYGEAREVIASNIVVTGVNFAKVTSQIVVTTIKNAVRGLLQTSSAIGVIGGNGGKGPSFSDCIVNGLTVRLETNCPDERFAPTHSIGGVVGEATELYVERYDIVQMEVFTSGNISYATPRIGSMVGTTTLDEISINDSIINVQYNLNETHWGNGPHVGGVIGQNRSMTYINGCDITVAINTGSNASDNEYTSVHGLIGCSMGYPIISDCVYKFSGPTANTGVIAEVVSELELHRNIIALSRENSTNAAHYSYSGDAYAYDNIVYAYGNTTNTNLFNSTAKAMFSEDDMYSLSKIDNGMGLANNFYSNKYIAHTEYYMGATHAYRTTSAQMYKGTYLSPLLVQDTYFHVYNTIDSAYASKLVYYNTAGASDTTVTVWRNGYNISALSASSQFGQTPNIWYAVGDDLAFNCNDSSYAFSASLQELNEVDEAVERTTIIAEEGSKDAGHLITATDVDYGTNYTPVLCVIPALGMRYFAIHKNMTISNGTATFVADRGNYKVYSATPGGSISVRISGNTLGYSTSATSYYTGLKKGSINSSGTYTNSSSLTASSSSASASGHYTYTFTVDSAYSSASSTGNVITYDYASATLYKQSITYSADKDGAGNSMTAPGSSKLYFTTSLTGTTKYTSLYVKSGTTITATYPSTSGEWTRTTTTLNSGSLSTNTSTSASYSATGTRTLTVTYACNTYEVEIWIWQEAAQQSGDYLYSDSPTPFVGYISEIDDGDTALALWGSYDPELQVTSGTSTQSAFNALYFDDVDHSVLYNFYRSAYVTYNSKNYIGSISNGCVIDDEWNQYNFVYRSYITAVKYNTSMSMTAVPPSMYKLSGATYNYTNKSTTSSGTATVSGNNISFKVLGSTTLKVDFSQDKWDNSSNYAAASLSNGSYVINTAAKFGWMVAKINESATYAGYSYSITADIDLAGKYISNITRTFTGTINGNQYTVKNINTWEYNPEGFISTNNGTIENIYFQNPSFNCTWEAYIGFVCTNNGTMQNVGVFSDSNSRYSLYRTPAAGGVSFVRGNNEGAIIDSCFDASNYFIMCASYGGLVHANSGTLSNSYSNVRYMAPSTMIPSGTFPNNGYSIATNNDGVIYNCYSRVNTPHDVMGPVGYNDGNVSNVFTDRNDGAEFVTGTAYKTSSEMSTASTFAGWEGFAQKWVMKTGSGTYKNQTITGYPLLNMGDTSDLVEIEFDIKVHRNGALEDSSLEELAMIGWSVNPETIYALSGSPISFQIALNGNNYYPYFESAEAGTSFSSTHKFTATNKAGTNTITWTPTFTSGATTAKITLKFYFPTVEMHGDYHLTTGEFDARSSDWKTSDDVGHTWNYGLNTGKKAIRIQTIKVCGVDVLTSASTTAVTRYIYKNGNTYTANTSDSGTGSKVCKIVITPSSTTAGTIAVSQQKENVTITTVTYLNISVVYAGLASGTTNTITTYQKLGSSGTAASIKTVRASGATTASDTVSVGWYPILSDSTYYYYGNVLGGNTKGYTYYQAGYNGSKSVVNANYASTDNYTHYVSADDLAGASSSPATFDYTYGPGKFTYTINIKSVSYLTTKPTKITITPSGTGVSDTAKSFSSVAANQTVTFDVLSGNAPTFTASYTAASGKVYRWIWGSDLSKGTANAAFTADSATAAKTYYISPIERYNFTATASLNMVNSSRTYATSYAGKYPEVSVTYTKNTNLAGSTGTTVTNTTTSDSISTGQVVDHGSAVTFSQSLDRTVDSTNGIKLSHVYTFGNWGSASSITSATASVSNTASFSVIVRTITTRITNKDLTIHPDAYIGIASNSDSYTFSSSTLHTTNSSGHYYVYYAGLSASTGSGDNVTRGYRTFYVTGGEFIKAERWDIKASNYQNDIASITHTSTSNTATEFYSSSASGILIGISMYVKANDDIKFTYYPLVEINLARTATTTSTYATNNKDTLLPITATRTDSAHIKVMGTKTSGTNPPYAFSTIDDTDNLFEPIVYMQLSYTVPTANLSGWNFDGWFIASTAIGTSGSKTVNNIVYTIASTTSGSNTIYTLKFTIEKQDEGTQSINTFQYYIKFTEKTYTFTAYTNLTSGGSTAVNNNAANRYLYQYTDSNYTDSTKSTMTLTTSGTNHTATIAYYGYYMTSQDSKDDNNYAYASGITINNCTTTADTVSGIDAAIKFRKPTADVTAYATYKKWHTISAPTITIDYTTSGYTDNQYNVTNDGYAYTFNARTSSSTANVAQIGTITYSGITNKNGAMKVLEGATLTITVTTNTNKFRITSTPASKAVTADTTVTAAYAENVLSIKFYKNTASTTQVGSTVSLGTLNAAYTIPSTYQATPGAEYVFSHWTASSSLEFGATTTLATTIKKESVNGANGSTINVYANWRRTYYMTWTKGTVSTSHTTKNISCAGGTITVTANGTAVSSKYSKASTASLTNSVSTGHRFVQYNPSNATISGNTATRTFTSLTVSSGQITYNSTKYYVSGEHLYTDSACKILFSAYDYDISGTTVKIYDKASATIGATFAELTYELTITQPTGGNITITSTTSNAVLPSGYTLIEYIQSSGTQYINTGYYWRNENVRVVLDGMVTTSGSSRSMFGNEEHVVSTASGGRYFGIIPHGNQTSSSIYAGSGSQGSLATTLNTRFLMDIYTTTSKTLYASMNGVSKISAKSYSGSVITNPNKLENGVGQIYIFANHNSGTGAVLSGATPSMDASQIMAGMRVYSFKMYDNDCLVRSFVPVKNSSGTVGLYDLVEQKFYTTPSGTFTAGANATDSNTKAVLGYFSSITLKYNNTDQYYRFKGWNVDNTAFSNTIEPNDASVTLGANVLKNSTVSVTESIQRKITPTLWQLRYLTSSTASYPNDTVQDIYMNGSTTVWKYQNAILYFTATGGAMSATNWAYTCTANSSHKGSSLASRPTTCATCGSAVKVTGVDMYVELTGDGLYLNTSTGKLYTDSAYKSELTAQYSVSGSTATISDKTYPIVNNRVSYGGATVTMGMVLTSNSTYTVPESASAVFYKFTVGNTSSDTWSIPFTNLGLGHNATGDTNNNLAITFLANGATLANQNNTYSFGIRPYDDVIVDDDTSTNNTHVYITSKDNPSIKVLEGANVTIIATDYNAATDANKAYKFSHWTFTPADSAYSSNANWMEAEGLKYTKNPTFAVYASREGTYTAHYVYAYKIVTDQASTTNGTTFTDTTVAGLTVSNPTYDDETYAKGSTITLTPDFSKTAYTFYGWYLKEGSTYTKITSSTTGCSLNGNVLTITVGGATCDNATVSGGLDLSKYTIVLAGQEVLSYTFGAFSELGPTATYTVSGAGIISATDGDDKAITVSNNSVSASLAPGKVMTVKVKAGTSLTFAETHTAGTHRSTGMTFNETNIASTNVTLANNGLTGASRAAITTSASNDGHYRVVYTPVWTVSPTLEVVATHVTSGKTASFTGSSYITLTASGAYTYNNVKYYDDGTQLTISKTLPTGYNFTSWTITPSPTFNTGSSATSESPIILLKAKLTKVTLNIKEKEFTVTANTVNVNIPANTINNISTATTWTDSASSFGTITYTTNHTGGNGKVGYFGTLSSINFNPYKYLYVSNSKLFYDANYTHAVYENLYKVNSSTSFTYLGTTYTASSGKITLNNNLYTFTTFANDGGGTLTSATSNGSASVTPNITSNVTISANVNMYVYYTQTSYNLATASSTVSGATTKTNTAAVLDSSVTLTAATVSGYVFKGWKYYTYVSGALTQFNSGAIVSTSTTYTFKASEALNGAVFSAVYAPLYSITITASTFSQGSVKYQYKTPGAESYNTLVTLTSATTLTGIEYNSSFKFTAVPKGQNRFNYWSTANSSVTNDNIEYTYTLVNTDTVTANFLTQYTITINHSSTSGGTYTVQEYNLISNNNWEWEDCENLVNVSGNNTLTTADSGKDYRVVVTTKANYRVSVSGTATASITGNNNYNNTSGTTTTTATYTKLNGAKTVTITHTPLTYVAVSSAPAGLSNTISIAQSGSAILASKSGTETIAKTTFEGGKSMTITTTAVDGYGTPKFYNGNTLLTEGTSYTFTPATGTTYNISVKYTSTDIAIDTVGYFIEFSYASITGSTAGNTSIVYNDGTSSIALTSGATGIRFSRLFDSDIHTSVSLYAGSTLVKTITSDTDIDYTLPVGSETPTLKLVFTNKTWLDTGYYTTPGGSGTPESPYVIDSAGDFAWISYQSLVNSNNFAGKYFSLTTSIDLSSRLWIPIQNFNGVIISTSLDNTIYCKYIIVSDSLQITGIGETSTSTYGGLVAESNGGVFRNITLNGTDEYCFMTIGNTYTHVALLCGKGTDVVVDNIYADYILHDYSGEDIKLAYIIAELNGGKLSNIAFGDTEMIGPVATSAEVHTSGAGTKFASVETYNINEETNHQNLIVGVPANGSHLTVFSDSIKINEGATIHEFEWALSQLESNSSIKSVIQEADLDFSGYTLSRSYDLPAGKTYDGRGYYIASLWSYRVINGNTGAIWNNIYGNLTRLYTLGIVLETYSTSTSQSTANVGAIAGYVGNGAKVHQVYLEASYSLRVVLDGTKVSSYINVGGVFGSVESADIYSVYSESTLNTYHYGAPANTYSTTSNCNAINIGGFAGSISGGSISKVYIYNNFRVKGDVTEKIGGFAGVMSNANINNVAVGLYQDGISQNNTSSFGTFAVLGSGTIDKVYVRAYGDQQILKSSGLLSVSGGTFTNSFVENTISSHASAKTPAVMTTKSTYTSAGWNFDTEAQYGTVVWYMDSYPWLDAEPVSAKFTFTVTGDGASGISGTITGTTNGQNEVSFSGAGTKTFEFNLWCDTEITFTLQNGYYLEYSTSENVTDGLFLDDVDQADFFSDDIYGPVEDIVFTIPASYFRRDFDWTFTVKKAGYTVDTTTNGHGTATGGGSYKFGDSVTLNATPTANETYVGHRFLGWYKNTSVLKYSSKGSGVTKISDTQYSFTGTAYYAQVYFDASKFVPGETYYFSHDVVSATVSSRSAIVIHYTSDGDSNTKDYIEVNGSNYTTGGKTTFSVTPASNRTISKIEFRFARLGNNTTQRTVEISNLQIYNQSKSPISTNATYTFTMNSDTAGTYEARFCDDSSRPCNYKASVSVSGTTASINPNGYVLEGTTATITVTLASGQEITKITRSSDSKDVYTKAGGVISGYTFTSPNKLSFDLNDSTKGAYVVTIGATSHNVTISVPNVGDGTTTGDGDAYSAHDTITMKSGSTTLGTIAANATSGIATVVYNNTLTISFMSAVRYKLGSIITTQSGNSVTIAGTDSKISVTTSTVSGYTRYTYTYTTAVVTGDFNITINMIKDRWVDFTSYTGSNVFGAGHSAEFITANGGRVAYETAGSTTNYTFDKSSAKGKGTKTNPFVISTAAQLARVAYLINSGAVYYYSANGTSYIPGYYYSAYYTITANIDLGNYFWTPINQNNATGANFSLGGDVNRTISNMYIRVDEEEYALQNTGKRNQAFVAYANYTSLYNLTFDNANVVNNSIKDVYTSVVFNNGYYSSFAFITVQNSYVLSNTYGNLFGGDGLTQQFHNIRVSNSTIETVKDSETKELGGFVASLSGSVVNNVIIENITLKENGTGYTSGGGLAGMFIEGSTLRNVFINVKSVTMDADYGHISRTIIRGNTFDNVWVTTLSGYKNYMSSSADAFTINTLTSGKTLANYGLNSDEWYIDSTTKLPYPKMVGTGSNQITQFAKVSTGTISGGGTKENPYLIDSANTLKYITYLINSGNNTYRTAYYKVTADIDLAGGFSSIIGDESTTSSYFTGYIDGDFHTISNLYIFNKTANAIGFIGAGDGTIKNLNFVNARIVNTTNGYVGGVFGYTESGILVDNVSYEGYVLAHSAQVGGIVGFASTSSTDNVEIRNVSFDGYIKGQDGYTAGIIGLMALRNNAKEIIISSASVSGSISGLSTVGGILGGINTKSTYSDKVVIKDSFNNANISIYYANGVGGIAGDVLNTTIENCYNNGAITILSQIVDSSSNIYNTSNKWNNGTHSWATNHPLFAGELVGRIYDGSVSYPTKIINSAFNQAKYIQASASSSYLIPLGKSGLNGHTEKGYSVYSWTSNSITYSNGVPEGEGQMYSDAEMMTVSPFTVWDAERVWSITSGSYPVHRWNTQNRLYIEGDDLEVATAEDGQTLVVYTTDGAYAFDNGVTPLSDSNGRIFVYAKANASLNVHLIPSANFTVASVGSRNYYTASYTSIMTNDVTYAISFGDYSDGTNFKALKATFVNSRFTITVNTELVRGTGIAVGNYETLHIVLLNTTTNEAYTTSLDNGTYLFDNLKAGTYYVGVYTTMFFNVSSVECTYDSANVNFDDVEFYYTLTLSNSTSPNATIDITATKNVDAWIYSAIEIDM